MIGSVSPSSRDGDPINDLSNSPASESADESDNTPLIISIIIIFASTLAWLALRRRSSDELNSASTKNTVAAMQAIEQNGKEPYSNKETETSQTSTVGDAPIPGAPTGHDCRAPHRCRRIDYRRARRPAGSTVRRGLRRRGPSTRRTPGSTPSPAAPAASPACSSARIVPLHLIPQLATGPEPTRLATAVAVKQNPEQDYLDSLAAALISGRSAVTDGDSVHRQCVPFC